MRKLSIILTLLVSLQLMAQNAYVPMTLPMEERATVIDSWLNEKITTVLPSLMERSGIDIQWIPFELSLSDKLAWILARL